MIDINLNGPYRTIKRCFPGMVERRYGRIVNFASTAANVGYVRHSAYCASKAGLLGLTRCVALEGARARCQLQCRQSRLGRNRQQLLGLRAGDRHRRARHHGRGIPRARRRGSAAEAVPRSRRGGGAGRLSVPRRGVRHQCGSNHHRHGVALVTKPDLAFWLETLECGGLRNRQAGRLPDRGDRHGAWRDRRRRRATSSSLIAAPSGSPHMCGSRRRSGCASSRRSTSGRTASCCRRSPTWRMPARPAATPNIRRSAAAASATAAP